MKLAFTFLFILMNLTSSWACNIGEKELMVRVAILKGDQAQHLAFTGPLLPPIVGESSITKKDFLKLIDMVKKVYVPIFRDLKMNFKIEHMWDDKQENAFAGVRGDDRYVILYGGYARHKLMTPDAYLSVICHEIGHHLGGFPKKVGGSWSSSEGQADYFSTLKCMKNVLREDFQNEAAAAALNLPEEVKKQCRVQFKNQNEYHICLRSAKAAEEHGDVIADLVDRGGNNMVHLTTPSEEVVAQTNLRHPSPQCRVDTKYQGALCNVSPLIALDDEDEMKGTCHFNNFTIVGNRPACWFVHKK